MSFWQGILDRLNDVPGPSRRIPTLAMLETQSELGLMRTKDLWAQATQSLLDIMEGELAFIETLKTLPPKDLEQMQKKSQVSRQAVFCLVKST